MFKISYILRIKWLMWLHSVPRNFKKFRRYHQRLIAICIIGASRSTALYRSQSAHVYSIDWMYKRCAACLPAIHPNTSFCTGWRSFRFYGTTAWNNSLHWTCSNFKRKLQTCWTTTNILRYRCGDSLSFCAVSQFHCPVRLTYISVLALVMGWTNDRISCTIVSHQFWSKLNKRS